MPFVANVIKVMIASPGDVADERQAIREAIAEWNCIHSEDRKLVLLPVGWETHSTPIMGDRPQAIINRQVLADCDLLVAVFWTRLGSPTGVAPSGTVEEIDEHLRAGKPAMLYFSGAPVRLDSVDETQYQALKAFKQECYPRGLLESYESLPAFRDLFSRQLAQTIIRYFPATDAVPHVEEVATAEAPPLRDVLSGDAKEMLLAAGSTTGYVMCSRTMSGTTFQAGRTVLSKERSARDAARWQSAVDELVTHNLIRDAGYKGEVFKVTHFGFQLVDELTGKANGLDSANGES